MAEFYADMRDLKFALLEQTNIDQLLALPKFQELDRDTVEAVIDEAFKFAKNQIAPMNADSDRIGSSFDPKTKAVRVPESYHESYKLYCENGWLSLSHSAEWGGQGMPYLLHVACDELFFAACLSFCLSSLLTTGAAHLIETFGNDEIKKRYTEKMYTGQWTGTMCLTESGAGTDVGACKTKAIRKGDHYLIEGEKIFITFGEHDLTDNIIHAVLARVEDAPPGVKGISLFVVPKVRVNPDGSLGEANDVVCSGIEHKMGIHGSPTCTMLFGENGDCHGWLLGEENKGMRAMFQMMNEARILVGLQGVAAAAAGYQQALVYAKERVQSKHVLKGRNPDAQSVPIIEHPDVRQMLMWQKATAEGGRALLLKNASFVDIARFAEDEKERDRYMGLVELLTPICKAYCTDQGFNSTSLSLQTLGGYGYVSEYPLEQLVRDVRIAAIYEGTNGVQAMDLIGRKLPSKGGANFMNLMNLIGGLIGKNKDHPALANEIQLLADAQGSLVEASKHFATIGQEKPLVPLVSASPYLDLFGQVTFGWLLLEQAVLCYPKLMKICEEKGVEYGDEKALRKLTEDDEEAKFRDGKIKLAQFYARRLPLCRAKADILRADDETPLSISF